MERYFDRLKSVGVEAVKIEYRTLAKRWHPDRPNGDTATMQKINAQYHEALKALDQSTSRGSDGGQHTYHYSAQTEQSVMDKLAELLRIRGKFEIMMIGTWLWVAGDTKPIKEELKKAGCQWHSKRQCWYWRPESSRHYGKSSSGGLEHLAAQYGATMFTATESDTKMTTS